MRTNTNYDELYSYIGLEPGAPPNAIKSAKKRLNLKYHPDRYPASEQLRRTKQLQAINEAVQQLLDYWNANHVAPPSETKNVVGLLGLLARALVAVGQGCRFVGRSVLVLVSSAARAFVGLLGLLARALVALGQAAVSWGALCWRS